MQDRPARDQAAEDTGSIRQPPPIDDRVFISYAREDETFVLNLASALKARGIPLWLDQWDILPGADWNRSIDRALHESRKVVIVLSPAAVVSRQVRAEIQLAVDAEEKAVFPVLYNDCAVPRILRLYQFSDFREPRTFEAALDRLAEALGAETTLPHVEKMPPEPKPLRPQPPRGDNRRLMLTAVVGAAALLVLVAGLVFALAPWRVSDDTPVPPPDVIHPPEETGNLQVSVNVDHARVSLDGTEVGIARRALPLILRGIPEGQYRLRVEATGYVTAERRITVAADQWTSEGVILRQAVLPPGER
jgi:hypothetical protein